MLNELVKNKVYYKFFDKSDLRLTHNYDIHNLTDVALINQAKSDIDKIKQDFGAKNILMLNQVHGNDVASVDSASYSKIDFELWPKADASITTENGVILAIRTADCVPILLASDCGNVIGAVHCGWRGAKLNIIKKLVDQMKQREANNIKSIIGPSIAQESYEVSEDFYKNFIQNSSNYQKFFLPSKKNKFYMFDLPSFVRMQLTKEDVKIEKHITDDTYKFPDRYPSYRRFMHRGELCNQRILSAVIIK